MKSTKNCYNIVTKETFSIEDYNREIAEYGILRDEADFINNLKTQENGKIKSFSENVLTYSSSSNTGNRSKK